MKKHTIYIISIVVALGLMTPFAVSQANLQDEKSESQIVAPRPSRFLYQVFRKKPGVKDPNALNGNHVIYLQEFVSDFEIHAGDYVTCRKVVEGQGSNQDVQLKVGSVQIEVAHPSQKIPMQRIWLVCD